MTKSKLITTYISIINYDIWKLLCNLLLKGKLFYRLLDELDKLTDFIEHPYQLEIIYAINKSRNILVSYTIQGIMPLIPCLHCTFHNVPSASF